MSRRSLIVLAAAALLLAGGGYALYRLGYFARDAEDGAEIARLGGKKIDPPPPAEAAAGWPQWRGPTRDGRAPTGPFRADWDKNPPKLLWKADDLGGLAPPIGGGFSSPVVAGGKVYLQDYRDGKERVVCLDAATGKFLWDTTFAVDYTGTDRSYSTGPRSTPTVEGDSVYVVTGDGQLLRINKAADKPAVTCWQHNLLQEFGATIPRWGVACSPLVEGDMVVVQPGGKNGSVVAFDKESGEVRWRAGKNPAGYSSPVAATVGGKRFVFALTGDALLAIRAADGTVTDGYDWKTDNYGNVATPLVVDDYVFISSAYQQGCALLRAEAAGDGVKFRQVYARRGHGGFQNHHSTSVFRDRHLFGFSGMLDSARLKCVDFDTGKEKGDWEASGIAGGSGSVILAGNHLVIQAQRGDLYLVAADPNEFRLVARVPKVLSGYNNWATPTLVDGRLYLRDEQKVVCYDVRP